MHSLSRYLLIITLVLLATSPANAFSEHGGKVYTLDNGLNVFIKPMKAAPLVALNVWVKVGAVNEEPEEEGYSRLIEHMMFKGTPTYPYGALGKEVKKMGLKQSAFTGNDYTCFYLVGASQFFEKMMELQADAVLNSLFDPDELKKEVEVIIEELKMSVENPASRVMQVLMGEAFKVHPYRNPIAGYQSSLELVTREKLYGYYKKFYVPANMWVVVVGDVDPAEALEVVKKYMGNAPNLPAPVQNIPVEPIQQQMKLKIEHAQIQHSHIRLGWMVPGIKSSDRYPLFIISNLVGGGMTSWLWREMVEQEGIAISAGTAFYSSQFPMLFQVGGVTTPGKARRFTEMAKEILYRLHEGEIAIEEIEKAKQQIIASDIFERQTAESQANNYGHYAMLTDVTDADRFVSEIRKVNLEDIRAVARKYFTDQNLTIVRLEPEPVKSDAPPEMITLDNGVRLILKENHASPVVAVSINIAAGSLCEEKREAGLANLTAEMLARGAKDMTAQEIAGAFESVGSRFGVKSSKSYVSFTLQALSENFLTSLSLMLDIIEKPDFPAKELDKLKDQIVDWINTEEDDLFIFTSQKILEELFPGTAIGYSALGKVDEVKKIKISQLKEFHKNHYVGANTVVAIVGNFYARELKERLLREFGRFSSSKPKAVKAPKLPEIKEAIEVNLQKNREQGQIIYAARTFPANDERVPSMTIAQTILSGGMSSRLFQNLRARDSLAYSTWAYNVGLLENGYFLASISTAAEKVASASLRLKEEIDSFRDQGFSDQEFEDAKKYLIGQYALGLADNLSLAGNFAGDELFGKGFDYYLKYPKLIENTSREQVELVAREFLLASGSYGVAITQP